ncbi:EAL and HDOD domain-containing protein [Clostridium fungisolvens]|uniref:Cyclic di-GMP phosphodiesterase CdgJ n=1 Tax=Clostridium fungisolvens TaxID=1604897 RepID=A0A6V8SJB6_9CLOT|nr:HDOD domain-containing protein [Clostridium fungisolvens]GFP74993.1 Cyclic di-GMP phosphodiesterase CdgJ [Clostridium fungisolvens]
MEIFIARQPIFTRSKKVFGYELLYRNSYTNKFENIDGDLATRELLSNTAIIELSRLTEGKKAFINFTKNTLLDELPKLLPKEIVIVEILEDVEFTEEVINACKNLKAKGYKIAIDDFSNEQDISSLVEIIDIVKVDFLLTTEEEQREICKNLKRLNIKALAEKVETIEDFEKALKVGYELFQGYFFSRPKIITGKHSPIAKSSFIVFIKELKESNSDFESLERFIRRDPSLCYKLIKYINSAHFGMPNKINSVKQAITLLGPRELEKWAILVSFNIFTNQDYEELSKNAMVRAHFCETLCNEINSKMGASAFLVGLFSYLDVIFSTDMKNLMEELPVEEEIKRALIKKDNFLYEILNV